MRLDSWRTTGKILAPLLVVLLFVTSARWASQRIDMLRGENRALRQHVAALEQRVAAQNATINEYMTVGEAAQEIGRDAKEIKRLARTISELIYIGRLDADLCILRGDRRMIPQTYLPRVREVLVSEGKLKQ